MVELLKTALAAGHKAKYVLFDSWFSNPQQILDIKSLGLDTIAMVKRSSKIRCYVVTFVKPQFSGILSEGILREP